MVLRRGFCNKQRVCQISSLLILFGLMTSSGMMLVSFSIGSYSSSNIDERVNTKNDIAGDIPHANIIINNDDDFVAQSWPGSGIEGDPYRIENLNISDGTSIRIYIQNTRAHALIKNCTVYGPLIGIKLDNVTNVVIEGCVFIGCDYGVRMEYSDFNLVSESNITNCASGIMFYNSHDNEFINNTVSVHGWRSIYISGSDRNTVHLNNLTGGFHGVYFSYSNWNIVSNNTCLMNGREVIVLSNSDNNTIIGNYLEGTSLNYDTIEISRGYLNKLYENNLTGKGIGIFLVQSIDAIGNTLNGRPLVFIVNEEYIDFSGDAGQVIILHSNNVTVRDQVIADVGNGIQVENCEDITLKDNIVANNTWNGIDIDLSPSTILQNNTCYGNEDGGIYISYSPDSIIEENTCFDNGGTGINVFDSDQSLVQDNVCYSNDYIGIYLRETYFVTVVNNNCTDTNIGINIFRHGNHNVSSNLLPDNEVGIYLSQTDENIIHMNDLSNYATEGILLADSMMNIVSNNTCIGNYGDVGIQSGVGSSDNVFTNNTIRDNNIGLHIEDGCVENIIYWNQFIDNALYPVSDNGTDSVIHNNYYSNYVGSDLNLDGIGDTPYSINGTAGNEDPYPLMSPNFSPEIGVWTTPPTDQTLEYGLEFDYQVDLIGPTIVSVSISDTIHFSIDMTLSIRNATNLAVGIYPLTVKVRNVDGHYLVSEFILNVSDTTIPTWIDFPTDQVREYNELFIYKLEATDISGIDRWELIVEEGFYIHSDGNITQSMWLPVGEYQIGVRVYDIHDNFAFGTFNLSIVDTILPLITNSGDFLIHELDSEEIKWSVVEHNLVSYVILLDGIEVDSGNQTNMYSEITYEVSGFGVGEYNFTLVVTDVGGNSVSSTIIVSVMPLMDETTPTSTTESTTTTTSTFDPSELLGMITLYLGLGGVVIVIVIIIKRRK